MIKQNQTYKPYPAYKDSGVEWIGEIPEGWNFSNLRWLINIASGEGLSNQHINNEKDRKHCYKVIGGNGTMGYSSFINTESKSFAIGRVGALCGNVHYIDEKCWITDNALKVSKWNGFSDFYLLYFLFSSNINVYANKNAQPLITGEQIKNLRAILPPLQEQTAIATFLDKKTAQIDTLIQKKKRLNELLKEEREAIINHAVTKGLPAATAAQAGLDPNAKMKDSGVEWIGEIPEGWEVKKIKHTCYVKGRVGWKGLKADEFLDFGYAYLVTGTDFKNDTIDWLKCHYIDKERYEEDPYIQLKDEDLLITKDGTIGKLAVVKKLDRPACLNSGIFVVRSLYNCLSTEYLFWVLKSDVFDNYNDLTSYGSTIQHLYQNVFVEFSFTLPPLEEQTQIANFLDKKTSQIDKTISNNEKEIELLTEYRAALISEAVTGKIDIRGLA